METTSTLFKQAIAEAKVVRETAVAAAKQSLEESITPEFRSMLATRLQELEQEDEDPLQPQEPVEAPETENPEEEIPLDEPEKEEEPAGMEDQDADDREIGDLSVEEFTDLLRNVFSGAEAQEHQPEDHSDMDAGEPEPEKEEEPSIVEPEAGEEEIDLDELLRELAGEPEPVKAEEKEENKELQEALKTIKGLRQELQEVNLLNAKLLYVSKVLKASNLTESQKVNVVAAFDKAENVREAKLIYQTVSESVTSQPKPKTPAVVAEARKGSASRVVGRPVNKPEIISEVNETVLRWQKLAGIIKD